MSLITLSSLERITAPKLADMLLAANAAGGESKLAVVDVRDDDHIGGHIRNSMHFPTQSLDATMPTLMRKLADKDTVVFHCALSQQRGPSAALRYLREKEAAGDAKKTQKVYVLDQHERTKQRPPQNSKTSTASTTSSRIRRVSINELPVLSRASTFDIEVHYAKLHLWYHRNQIASALKEKRGDAFRVLKRGGFGSSAALETLCAVSDDAEEK
ncbi:hypothetical protein F5Y07DRAFT_404707 [Xylaria sp. FL0933]|nr:hypothetical protein F5Y07DRAFT_404707 [Xylaria sp. FL0933]